MNYDLLQSHTVEIYHLRDHVGRISRIPARSLLKPQRFDLFAKLYYIDNIESNKEQALRIYVEHIKAFNPDGREPGRDDKNGVSDFVDAFNQLISRFKQEDFDETQSVVPVDKNGVILDGAHRVAALAYFDRHVVVAQFDDVVSKCDFDYLYFRNRAMPWSLCDIIALEMTKWLDTLMVACIWPSVNNNQRRDVVDIIRTQHGIAYAKDFKCDLKSLSRLIGYIYRHQEWTMDSDSVMDKAARVYGRACLSLVFFTANCSLDQVIKEKESIRSKLGRGKDSLHITDNSIETRDIAQVTLDKDRILFWTQNTVASRYNTLSFKAKEHWFIFKKKYWLSFKVFIYNLIKK